MSATTRKERRAYAEMFSPNSFPDMVRRWAKLPVWLYRAMKKGTIKHVNPKRFGFRRKRRQ